MNSVELRERLAVLATTMHNHLCVTPEGNEVALSRSVAQTIIMECDEAAEVLDTLRAENAPTPESLRAMAAWFDDPNDAPAMWAEVNGKSVTAGYMLRRIAEGMERCTPAAGERPAGERDHP